MATTAPTPGAIAYGASTSGLSVVVPTPAGVGVGDYLVAFVCSQESTVQTFTASGWSVIATPGFGQTNVAGARVVTVLGRAIADAAALAALPASTTFTKGGSSNRNVGIVQIIKGVKLSAPVNAVGTWASNSSSTTTTVPAATTTVANTLVYTVGNGNAGANVQMLPTTVSGSVRQGYYQSPAGTADSDVSASRTLLGVFSRAQAVAGSTGTVPHAQANASGQKAAFQIAFTPADEVVVPGITPTTGAKYWDGSVERDVQLARWDGNAESRIASLEAYDENVYDWAAVSSERPFFIAHRGGSYTWPEMSAAAYRRAARIYGMRALELSVHRSSDGVFVLHHDPTTTRATGQAYTIATTPWSTLSTLKTLASKTSNPNQPDEFLARLDQVLPLYMGNRVIFLEDKTYNAQNRADLIAYVKSLPGWQSVVWKVDGNTGNAAALAGANAGMRSWGYFFSGYEPSTFAANASRFDFIGPDMNFTAAEWAQADATGKPFIAHIIQTQAQLDTVLSHSPVGVMLANAQLFPR